MDAGLSITFNDKSRVSKDRVTLDSRQYRYANVQVINSDVTFVDAKIRRRWNAGLKYFYNTNTVDLYNLGDLTDTENYYEDESGNRFYGDGIKYSAVDYDNLSGKPDPSIDRTIPGETSGSDYDYDYKGWITSMTVNGVAIGISHEVIRNTIIDVENYGKRGNQKITTWYADLLLASVNVDKIIFFGPDPDATEYGYEMGTQKQEFDLSGSGEHKIETSSVGFRIGFESKGISPTRIIPWAEQDETTKSLNLGYKFEAGVSPGIKGKGLYMLLGIYFIFNGSV
jgi:hypothetical protein